jgi:hypothetical protein
MWTAVRKEVGLAIGFPDLNCGEDEYFGKRIRKYCEKTGKKIVFIDDLIPQHRHRSTLKAFLKVRWKYGQSAILLKFVERDPKLPIGLVVLLGVFTGVVSLFPQFFLFLFLGLVGIFLLTKLRLWRWIVKNFGGKVTIGCIILTIIGGLVSLAAMYHGLGLALKRRGKIKVWAASSCGSVL